MSVVEVGPGIQVQLAGFIGSHWSHCWGFIYTLINLALTPAFLEIGAPSKSTSGTTQRDMKSLFRTQMASAEEFRP
jgi:hypothetical protein